MLEYIDLSYNMLQSEGVNDLCKVLLTPVGDRSMEEIKLSTDFLEE